MKTITSILLFVFCSFASIAQQTTVTVKFDLSEAHGDLFVLLLNEDGTKNDSVVITVSHLVEDYTFTSVEKGKKYAIKCFHDMNGNGELDANFFGMPTEGYGFSNNVRGSVLGPPELKDQLFIVSKPTVLFIDVE